MDVALEMLENEGYEHIFARHAACAAAAKAGLQALGFKLFAEPAMRLKRSRRHGCPRRRLGSVEQIDALARAWSLPAARIVSQVRSCALATSVMFNLRTWSRRSRSSAKRSMSSGHNVTSPAP